MAVKVAADAWSGADLEVLLIDWQHSQLLHPTLSFAAKRPAGVHWIDCWCAGAATPCTSHLQCNDMNSLGSELAWSEDDSSNKVVGMPAEIEAGPTSSERSPMCV